MAPTPTSPHASRRLTGGTIARTANAWGGGVVWGSAKTLMTDGDNIVWGTTDGDNVVWGTDCGGADCDNIVWGTVDGDNVVWGTSVLDGDNIVWGTSVLDGDNIVWGTSADGDNLVWGTSTDVTFGNDPDAMIFADDPTEPLPSLDLDFSTLVPLAPDSTSTLTAGTVSNGGL